MRIQKLFLLVILSTCFCIPLFAKSKKVMYIAVQQAVLREKPSFRAKESGSLDYGTQIFIIEEKDKWAKVSFESEQEAFTGWISKTAMTKKKLNEKPMAVSADTKEIALAGKGFGEGMDSEIEKAYSENKNLDFKILDKLEETVISEAETVDFITEGNLFLGGEE